MRILYFMHIDWDWIKQRPQFLALELCRDYEVDVLYLKEVFRKLPLQKNAERPEHCGAVPAIPFRDKSVLFAALQRGLFRVRAGRFFEYDLVWLTHPALVKYIPKAYKGRVIYDCMDYHVAMCDTDGMRGHILKCEQRLAERADLILVSSLYLQKHIESMGRNGSLYLLRNGYQAGEIRKPVCQRRKMYRIGYIGTLSEWFDWALLAESLKRFGQIEYHLLGPRVNCAMPEDERLCYDGVREHEELMAYSESLDCLIMPFRVNELIKAVDPVKLYEYISMGKCIISVYYEEIERFRPFVYFYQSREEYLELIRRLLEEGFPPKYSGKEQEQFLRESTWGGRGRRVKELIGE